MFFLLLIQQKQYIIWKKNFIGDPTPNSVLSKLLKVQFFCEIKVKLYQLIFPA